ncbi:MAG: YtxH domain-containing protein [Bacillota bacterium]|nr:YtxH domain-containing protein [Bacillota bacterium]
MARGFVSGVTAGAIIGAAVGLMILPELDKDTKKMIKRNGRMMLDVAGGVYNTVRKMRS